VTWSAWWAAHGDCYIPTESGNMQSHGQHNDGQQMETTTYPLRVETESDMIRIMVDTGHWMETVAYFLRCKQAVT